ncbi:hypothetical protein FQR65_LT17794 [Abscondita terminalis]|nr:hypothetical protein FQR65_LT17794 [Abscondita terminalis]
MEKEEQYEYYALLKKWDLDFLHDSFIEEGINDESFRLLDEATINENNAEIVSYPSTSASTDTSICENYSFNSDIQFNDKLFTVADLDSANIIVDENISPNILVNPSVTPLSKKIKQDSIFSAGSLENLLNNSSEGKIILLKKDKLNNDLRQKLAKIIINDLINNKGIIVDLKANTFIKAASEIIDLFPRESPDTYYIPYTGGKISGLRRQPARGKLWSRYINVKGALRLAASQTSTSTSVIHAELPVPDDDQEESLTFLKNNIGPYNKVLLKWEQTYEIRRKLHRNEDIDKIFSDLPVLKQSYAVNLIESDFNQEFADKIDIIYQQWPKVASAILEELSERNINSSVDVQDLDTSTEALANLSYLFSPVTLKRKSENKITPNWRPTRSEIQDSFFFILKDFNQISEKIERRKVHLDSFNIPLQPFGCAIINREQLAYYIHLNGITYECEPSTSIRCLELLYKIYHALNLEYQLESKHIWLFIQELVFKTPATSKSSSTACAIADIKYHLDKI